MLGDFIPNQDNKKNDDEIAGDSPESEFLEEEPSKEEDSDSPIFRHVSIERLSIPDQLDRLFIPFNPPFWLVWIASGVLSAAALIWLFFGSIPLLIEGTGIVMNREGIYTIESKTKGIVEELLVNPGEIVKKGQLVAKINTPQEKLKYTASIRRVRALGENLDLLEKQVQAEREGGKKALDEQIQATTFTIDELENAIPSMKQELQQQEILVKQKLMSPKEFHATKEVLSQNQVALETAKANLAVLKANLAKSYREGEIQEKRKALLDARQENQILKMSMTYNNVYAFSDGRVLEILVNKGSHLQSGTPLMHMEYQVQGRTPYIFYAFVPIEAGKGIQLGTRVEVELSTVKAEEYGAMIGHITAVSSYAISKESIANMIQNEGLVNFLTKGASAAIQITVEPMLDPSTPTGYKWTSGQGPTTLISTGTVCIVRGIIDRVQPLFYFFSFWKLSPHTGDTKTYSNQSLERRAQHE